MKFGTGDLGGEAPQGSREVWGAAGPPISVEFHLIHVKNTIVLLQKAPMTFHLTFQLKKIRPGHQALRIDPKKN